MVEIGDEIEIVDWLLIKAIHDEVIRIPSRVKGDMNWLYIADQLFFQAIGEA